MTDRKKVRDITSPKLQQQINSLALNLAQEVAALRRELAAMREELRELQR
jgi:hypothetical protein